MNVVHPDDVELDDKIRDEVKKQLEEIQNTPKFEVGEQVIWLHTPRGGYGYQFPIPAQIIKFNSKTVTLMLHKTDGSVALRNVKVENLRKRK